MTYGRKGRNKSNSGMARREYDDYEAEGGTPIRYEAAQRGAVVWTQSPS